MANSVSPNSPTFSYKLLHPKYWLLWLCFGFFALLANFPFSWQLAIGRGLGKLFYQFARERRKIAAVNIKLCFPDWSEEQRAKLLYDNMLAMGIGLMEQNMGWFMPKHRLLALTQVQGVEHLQQLSGGAIVVFRHTSTIQLAVVAATMFSPLAGMYRAHKNPVMDYVQRACRERMDRRCQAFERKEVRTMLRFLRQGVKVLFAPDQDYGIKQSVWAKFFGVTAATVTSTSRFSRLGNAKVIMLDFVRKPGNQGYLLSFSPPLEGFPSDDEQADVQRMNDLIEAQIRQVPEQYLWVHRRFKSRPAGEKRPY